MENIYRHINLTGLKLGAGRGFGFNGGAHKLWLSERWREGKPNEIEILGLETGSFEIFILKNSLSADDLELFTELFNQGAIKRENSISADKYEAIVEVFNKQLTIAQMELNESN